MMTNWLQMLVPVAWKGVVNVDKQQQKERMDNTFMLKKARTSGRGNIFKGLFPPDWTDVKRGQGSCHTNPIDCLKGNKRCFFGSQTLIFLFSITRNVCYRTAAQNQDCLLQSVLADSDKIRSQKQSKYIGNNKGADKLPKISEVNDKHWNWMSLFIKANNRSTL